MVWYNPGSKHISAYGNMCTYTVEALEYVIAFSSLTLTKRWQLKAKLSQKHGLKRISGYVRILSLPGSSGN